jgi:hypothetical protein
VQPLACRRRGAWGGGAGGGAGRAAAARRQPQLVRRGRAGARRASAAAPLRHLPVQQHLAAPGSRLCQHVCPQAPLQVLQLHCLDARMVQGCCRHLQLPPQVGRAAHIPARGEAEWRGHSRGQGK